MKLFFYNIQPDMARAIRARLELHKHKISVSVPESIALLHVPDDSIKARTYIRNVLLANRMPLFIFSAAPQVAALAWKLNAAYYTDLSEKEWLGDFAQGFNNFLAKNTASYQKKITIPSQKRIDFVSPDEVVYLKADRNYTEIYLENGSCLVIAKNLSEVEKMFATHDFIERFGKSIILNLNAIKSIQEKTVEFKNGHKLNFPKYAKSFVYLKERLMWKAPKIVT